MKKALIVFLVTTQLYALGIHHSLTCNENQLFQLQGINCCQSRVSIEQCQSILPEWIKDDMQNVWSAVESGEMTPPNIPNCHYTAVSFNYPNLLPLEKLEDATYENILKEKYYPITQEELKHGDLILFYLTAKERIYHPATFKVYYKDVEGMAHSAIYLEDGIIFQKESNLTDVYSIDTIEGTRQAYQAFMNSSKLSHVRISLKYYRARN